jgi:hypothetical protein
VKGWKERGAFGARCLVDRLLWVLAMIVECCEF